jgi:hypothetical protein
LPSRATRAVFFLAVTMGVGDHRGKQSVADAAFERP